MSKLKGSMFYKHDKDISDALKQKTPSKNKLQNHLKNRGLLLSTEDTKEDIAEYIAPWFTSYFDQKFIVEEKGGGNTQKKYNNVEIDSEYDNNDLKDILKSIKRDKDLDMNFTVTSYENSTIIEDSYTEPDFTKNTLSQNIPKTAEIEIIKTSEGKTLIRSNNDEYAKKISSIIRNKLREKNPESYKEFVIDFSAITDSTIRTEFFFNLTKNVQGYKTTDMKSVAVDKIDSAESYEYGSEEGKEDEDDRTLGYIKRVMLNGGSVHQSPELMSLLDKGFYITRIEWTMESNLTSGEKLDFYAEFRDTDNCSDFMYAIQKVYTRKQDGNFTVTGKSPSTMDNKVILPNIESSAKEAFKLAKQDPNEGQLEESHDEDD